MNIEIDKHSGFCFGVTNAVNIAEKILEEEKIVYCLGDIVHNEIELKRLTDLGLVVIDHEQLNNLKNVTVLIRAHGEPPSTYETIKKNNIKLIDATCPVVIHLQKKIKKKYDNVKEEAQVVIYGKPGHAEVIGLMGQTENKAIVVQTKKDISKLDLTRPIHLYSQTTMPLDGFNELVEELKKHDLHFTDTICRKVSNRVPILTEFVKDKDLVLFVSGQKSSNGKVLYNHCKELNPNTKFISNISDIEKKWLNGVKNIGICGATSTPQWLLKKVKDTIDNY
jgi:4-hydroxy-3-methylbut-2-enyl diphosphate reductase